MMLGLPVIKDDIISSYIDEKNMIFFPDIINNKPSNIGNILPMNLIALVKFEEIYRYNKNFSSSNYINNLLFRYWQYQSDSKAFDYVVENLIRFYYKIPHFAKIYFQTNYFEVSNEKLNILSYKNNFTIGIDTNVLKIIKEQQSVPFDFIIIQISENFEKRIKFIQFSTSNDVNDHMILTMEKLSR
jgi:hypothetical protein